MIPTIVATTAFNRGPPGTLIKRAKFGFKKAAAPMSITNKPTMRKIRLVIPIFPATLLEFHSSSIC